MRILLAPVCAAACVALAYPSPASPAERLRHAASTEHLYVNVNVASQTQIWRFPFVDGFPSKRPDLVYQNVQFPLAVGHDGTLYATVPLACCFGLGMVDVFPPNSNTISRQITLPNLHQDTTIDTALVEGPNAYLYVGYAAFISGARVAARSSSALRELESKRRRPLQGVAVYPPTANGGGPPVQMFDVRIDVSGPDALAFDRQGLLHMSTADSGRVHTQIYTVASPLRDPTVVGFLDLFQRSAYGMGFSDAADHLYAVTPVVLEVYRHGASGRDRPERSITLPANPTYGPGFAGPNVYVGVYSKPQVVAYDKDASGSPKPVFVLDLTGQVTTITGLAAGR